MSDLAVVPHQLPLLADLCAAQQQGSFHLHKHRLWLLLIVLTRLARVAGMQDLRDLQPQEVLQCTDMHIDFFFLTQSKIKLLIKLFDGCMYRLHVWSSFCLKFKFLLFRIISKCNYIHLQKGKVRHFSLDEGCFKLLLFTHHHLTSCPSLLHP